MVDPRARAFREVEYVRPGGAHGQLANPQFTPSVTGSGWAAGRYLGASCPTGSALTIGVALAYAVPAGLIATCGDAAPWRLLIAGRNAVLPRDFVGKK